jgi:hypothetical protein
MQGLLKQPGYRLYPPDSPKARALLAERGLTRADLDHAIAELEQTEDAQIRTIVGINTDGVFGSRQARWHPTCPTPIRSPSSPCSGSRCWSCSAASPGAARRSSARTAPCRTERSQFSTTTQAVAGSRPAASPSATSAASPDWSSRNRDPRRSR